MGAGNTTGSDSLGNPTGYNDQTTAQINTATIGIIGFNGSTSQTLLRVTGITFQFLNSTSSCSISFGGGQQLAAPTPFLRVDHTHWTTTLNGDCLAATYAAIYGVIDHNVITMPISTSSGQSVINFWRVGGGWTGDGFASGAYTYNQPTSFGSGSFLFFENNSLTGGYLNDCNNGGREVFRYNTINHAVQQGHEMEGDARGCRATEYYHNHVTCDANNGGVTSTRVGTMLVWGNTTTGCSGQLIGLNLDRTDGHIVTTSNGADWGSCGTQGVAPVGPSPWDQNQGAPGYACADQPGRGQGDYIYGSSFGYGEPMRSNVTLKICPTTSFTLNGPVTCPSGYTIGNTSLNGGSWPRNALDPVYEWMDSAQGQVGGDCYNCQANRDYYQESVGQTAQTSPTSPFNGAGGDGHGTLANRPTTCTAGSSANATVYNTNGVPGVGYWATDANGGSGEFYVCTATNTWTAYYTPYTYPHPFTGGTAPAGSVSISPSSENFGSISIGASSSAQTATVTNTTTSAVTVSSTAVTGTNSADFLPLVSNTCTGTVPANTGSCGVAVKFTPSIAGAESATLTVTLSSGPLTVGLSGTGVSAGSPGTSYSPNPMAFGNVVVNQSRQLTLTITNTGTVTLSISANALGDTSVWTKNTSTCLPSASVAPGGTCTIGITFSPTSAVNKATTLTVTSNAPSSPDVINLSGSGILVPTTSTGVILQGVMVQ